MLEAAIRQLPGVTGCRVVRDVHGEIAEIHVVSTGDRPPKLLIRDIQSLLLVNFNVEVPHRKISVAVLQEGPGSARGLQAREPPGAYGEVAPPSAAGRVGWEGPGGAVGPPGGGVLTLDEVGLSLEGPILKVRVELTGGDGRQLTGRARGPNRGIVPALLGARAVVEAVEGQQEWQGVVLQWVELAGAAGARAVVVSVVRPARVGPGGRGHPPAARDYPVEALGARPAGGNVTLAAAAAAVEALVKLLPPLAPAV